MSALARRSRHSPSVLKVPGESKVQLARVPCKATPSAQPAMQHGMEPDKGPQTGVDHVGLPDGLADADGLRFVEIELRDTKGIEVQAASGSCHLR